MTSSPKTLGLLLVCAVTALAAHEEVDNDPTPVAEAPRVQPSSAVDLQAQRRAVFQRTLDGKGREFQVTLIDLQPSLRSWYVLRREWVAGGDPEVFHLENPAPRTRALALDPQHRDGIMVVEGERRDPCRLWGGSGDDELARARTEGSPYVSLCDGRVFLRNPVRGLRSWRESAADFLRDRVWRGERLSVMLRDTFYKDAFRIAEASRTGSGAPAPGGPIPAKEDGPRPARLEAEGSCRIEPVDLGLGLVGAPGQPLEAGVWYPLPDLPGGFLSAVTPGQVATAPAEAARFPPAPLDAVERTAMVYLVAFDLARFRLGFELGTEHPRVGWSEQVPVGGRDPSLPGPDGFATISPLARTGMLSPADAGKVAAVFAGGFKRSHGVIRFPPVASAGAALHYGFASHGVVLSRLQPGLATVYATVDGRVDLRTWNRDEDRLLPELAMARQNGVPLVETDPVTGLGEPGALVTRWRSGNWSGSIEGSPRTVRAGLALQEQGGKRFLVFAFFSTATPSAMARVLVAYGVRYAMLLDMNAHEHTYLAIHSQRDGKGLVQHLVKPMAELDRQSSGQYLPRFMGLPDSRDFFHLTHADAP